MRAFAWAGTGHDKRVGPRTTSGALCVALPPHAQGFLSRATLPSLATRRHDRQRYRFAKAPGGRGARHENERLCCRIFPTPGPRIVVSWACVATARRDHALCDRMLFRLEKRCWLQLAIGRE